MIRRPKPTDTEEDLLAFQEKFISSGENPSAAVKAPGQRKVKVGSKRDQYAPLDHTETQPRDVVDLHMGGGMAKPPPKRSKFKEERLKKARATLVQDQHEMMDSQDTHITKILSEIQEREVAGYPLPTTSRYTRDGFPSVQTLDPTIIKSDPSVKKSLFAQQFEAHGPSFFGVVEEGIGDEPMVQDPTVGSEEPVQEGLTYKARSEWLDPSSLISGEGLVSAGVSVEAATNEVKKIHEENAQRLLSLSEEEIKKERDKVLQQLDPGLLAFLKTRHLKQESKLSTNDHMTTDHTLNPPVMSDITPQPLPPGSSPPTSWIHMDVVEGDKMEWMTDVGLSGEAPAKSGTNEMRFSLEGLIIPRSVVLPTHLGLHHHGDEPQAAGYTLTELLSLCRSAVLQQRTFSLQLLAKIIQRARLNEYPCEGGGAGDSVLEQLLAFDVPLLLRYALDESIGSVMFAAATGLHSLLVVPVENNILDEFTLGYYGCVLPALRSKDRQTDEENKNETDSELIHRDIVLGYLKMKLLPRLRYILEVCTLPTPLPSHLLDVVTRITRHSLYAATEVFNCPRLINVVFDRFLPLDWSTMREGVVDGKECVSAMKLIHALCSASRNITASLFSQHKLSSVLVRYSVPPPSELGLPLELSLSLSASALLVWSVALSYGLATQPVRDTFSELLRQLHSVSTVSSSPLQAVRDRALLCLVESALRVAAVTPDQLRIEGTTDTHSQPAIDWSHAQAMLAPLLTLLEQLAASPESASCTGNVLHCLASFYHLSPPNVSPVDLSEELSSLFDGSFSSIIVSSFFTDALHTLRDSSPLVTPSQTFMPAPLSLISHHTLPTPNKPALYGQPSMQSADHYSLAQPRLSLLTAANLVWGCVRLLRASLHTNKASVSKLSAFIHGSIYREYLEKVAQSSSYTVSSFDLAEVYLLYDTVLMFQSLMEFDMSLAEQYGQLTFDLGHKLLKLLPLGLECVVQELISTVTLHPSLIRIRNQSIFLEQDVTSLSLRDQPQPVTIGSLPDTISQLLNKSLSNIHSIRSTYLKTLRESGVCSPSKITRSDAIFGGHPFKTTSKLLPPCHTHILPEDWVLLPIVQEYNRSTLGKKVEDTGSERVFSMVKCSLQLLLLLEHLHPHLLRALSASAKLTRLMCVFLIDSELFFEKSVHDLLASLLSLFCSGIGQLDFTAPVPGLISFSDLYSNLLEQFSAVSYGDHLFSCFLLLPLQQQFSSHLRKMVWGEHPAIIRVFSLPLAEIPVPLERFLTPIEMDQQLLDMYISALSAEIVRCVWSPVFHLMAIHHVQNFIFCEDSSKEKERRKLLQRVVSLTNLETKRNILLYDGVDVNSLSGLKFREQLTEKQLTIITSLLGTAVNVL